MFKPVQSLQILEHQHQHLDDTFGILCWNVHKENLTSTFETLIHQLLQHYPSNLLLFQEMKISTRRSFKIRGYSFAFSANIQTRRHFYGVMSLGRTSFEKITPLLTHSREAAGIATHKSLLITTHKLPNAQSLLVINLHAINFVPLKTFLAELLHLREHIASYKGAMILAGDFNNWSKKRRKHLESFSTSLSLTQVVMRDAHNIKSVFSQPLDHIFFRGLTLLDAIAIDTGKFSDHNPIYAKFSLC